MYPDSAATTMRAMLKLRTIVAALLAVLGLWLWAVSAFAYDQPTIDKADRAAQSFNTDLASIDNALQLPTLSDTQLTDYRGKIEDIRSNAITLSASLTPQIADIADQLKLLPPAPAPGALPEAPAVTEQRDKLNKQMTQVQGIKSQLDVAASTADQLASRASAQQRNLFLTRVFEGGRSILNPSLWRDMGLGLGLFSSRLATMFHSWWASVGANADLTALLLIPAMLFLVGALIAILRRRFLRWSAALAVSNRVPSDIERVWRVVRAVLVVGFLFILLFLPVYLALRAGGFTTPRFDMVYWGIADIVAGTCIYWLLALRLSAPHQPAWRMIDLDEIAATRLPPLVAGLAFVSSFTSSTGTIADALYLPVTYTIGQSALSALVMLVLLALILATLSNQSGLPNKPPGRMLYFTWAGLLTPLLWLLIAAGFVSLLFGYVALASYIAQQITDTIFLVVTVLLLHHLTDTAVAASLDPQTTIGRILRRITRLGERAIERVGLITRVVVDLLLLVIGLPLLFVQWAVTWIDFRGISNTAILGFRIGSITISPWLIIVVALTLFIGVLVTNLFVRWLDKRVLTETRIDKGVQDSLRKGISYAGYILAFGIAVTAAGFDFSAFTIIFGALGVTIGFGLQAIVNNFASGLILLAERPVRVGDWVVTDHGEGLVKKINVRTTVIETFDHCTLILPNSMLVNAVVRNWTHGDTMGQTSVEVTVEYGSDGELVRQLLLATAKAHPKVLSFPEPNVFLQKVGPLGLEFVTNVAVADIFYGAFVATDLRLAILKVFAEKSIRLAQPVPLLAAALPQSGPGKK